MVSILQDFFKKLLNKFMKKINLSVETNFKEGSIRVLNMADREDLKPLPPTNQEKDLLTGQIFENIKGVTDSLNKDIKNAIRNSLLEKESTKQTEERLRELFKDKKDFTKARIKMIVVTETARIQNAGSMKTAKRLGFTHKYIGIVNDSRTAEDSKLMFKKYGSEEKAIPIDEEFNIVYNGKEQRGQYPPLRPNDRELVFFTNKEDKE